MPEQQQQLISTISTSRLRRGCALQENNLAPRLESKTESPKVACFHAIFYLCLVFGGTLAHTPFALSSLFPPRLPSSLPLPFHSFLHLLVFFPLLLFPPMWLFCLLFQYLRSLGDWKCSSRWYNTSNWALNLRRGVKQKLLPLTPPLSFALGSEVSSLLFLNLSTPLTGPYWLWPFGITTVIWQNIVCFFFFRSNNTAEQKY